MPHRFFNRREFIRKLAQAGLLTTVGCTTRVTTTNPEKIIIIGAGMAGVSAGRKLADAGHHVTILEARSRIGGRMWTSRAWEGAPVDLGASWIHGPRGNPLTRIADEIDARRAPTDSDEAPIFDASGNKLDDDIWDQYNRLQKRIYKAILKGQSRRNDLSVRALINQEVTPQKLSSSDRLLLDYVLHDMIEQEAATDVEDLSVHRLTDGDEFAGEDVVLPDGYDALPRHLAQGLDIRFNNPVNRIQYSEESVKVEFGEESMSADRVIVTLPIGVLKANTVEFSPELPQAKRSAINSIGVGVMNKLALRFPTVFWEREADWIGRLVKPTGNFTTWLSAHRSSGYSVLTAFHVGSEGRSIESKSDSEIVAEAMIALRQMYGTSIPNPTGHQMTRWHSDPFARCSYSSPAVGMPSDARAKLNTPVKNRLFFAGEATHESHPATVHGAYMSGQRESNRIMKLARTSA